MSTGDPRSGAPQGLGPPSRGLGNRKTPFIPLVSAAPTVGGGAGPAGLGGACPSRSLVLPRHLLEPAGRACTPGDGGPALLFAALLPRCSEAEAPASKKRGAA